MSRSKAKKGDDKQNSNLILYVMCTEDWLARRVKMWYAASSGKKGIALDQYCSWLYPALRGGPECRCILLLFIMIHRRPGALN